MLYWGSGSPPCWRAMLALEEKALQGYSHKLLSFSQKEHKGDEVKSINPRGQVSVGARSSKIVVLSGKAPGASCSLPFRFSLETRDKGKARKENWDCVPANLDGVFL